jgi:hypothetical protein
MHGKSLEATKRISYQLCQGTQYGCRRCICWWRENSP